MCILPTVELPLGDVLVASPSAGLRKQLVHSFHYPGREFAEAAAGTEALARLGQAKWQLLLLDRQLPDVDAAELREIILRRCARLPVLVFHRQRNAPSCREGNGSSPTPEYSRPASSVGCRPVRYRASDADAAEITPAWHGGCFPRDAKRIPDGAAGCAAQHNRSDHRRYGHGKGVGGARDSPI